MIRNTRYPSISIRVILVGKLSGTEISASGLIDSGAEGLIIDYKFAMKHKLTLQTLKKPLPAHNVDGSENSNGQIKYTTIQKIHLRDTQGRTHDEIAEFYITNTGDHDLVLGTDWLRYHNPKVDWVKDRLLFSRCPSSCLRPQGTPEIYSTDAKHPLSLCQVMIPEEDPEEPEPDLTAHGALVFPSTEDKDVPLVYLAIRACFREARINIRAKSTTSMHLAIPQQKKLIEDLVPPQFLKYHKVFDEKASQRLPSHQAWDHAIELKPDYP